MSKKHFSILLFITGFFLFMFTRRSELFPTIQIMILVAPIFILRFSRTQSTKKGILLTFLGFFLSLNIALFGLFDLNESLIELFFNIFRSTIIALMYFLPYLVDRLVYPKFKLYPIISSLIFPVSVTAIFFLFSLEGPIDGTVAKTIYAFGPTCFQQLNSITGLWGFIFLFSWLTSIINQLWENKFKLEKVKKILIIFVITLLAILVFGAVKINFADSNLNKVKVAIVILLPENGKITSINKILSEKIISPFNETILRIEKLTNDASSNGAKIVAFQEFSITINEKDQGLLKEELKRIAKENNVYLDLAYAYFAEKKGENKNLLIDNEGQIKIEYPKRYLLGFGNIGETKVFKKGAEKIQSVETPYGKIAVSICRDMNFPSYIREASKQNVDIVINPSYDNPKSLTPAYYERAIENGFSTIRPVYNGVSYIEDYNGKIIAEMDSDATETGVLYANIPTKGINTIYSKTGDWLGWFSLFVLFIIGVGLTKMCISKHFKLIKK